MVSVLCVCRHVPAMATIQLLSVIVTSALAVLKTAPISPTQLVKQKLSHVVLFVPLSQRMDDVVLILELWRCHVCNTSPFKWVLC